MKCETTLKIQAAVRLEIMKVDWDSCWGESRSTKPCVFRKSWKLPPVCDGCGCGRVAVPPLCSAMSGCSCVSDSMRLLTPFLEIEM